jgi:hypothetical protein
VLITIIIILIIVYYALLPLLGTSLAIYVCLKFLRISTVYLNEENRVVVRESKPVSHGTWNDCR